jgi:hypothetical protein
LREIQHRAGRWIAFGVMVAVAALSVGAHTAMAKSPVDFTWKMPDRMGDGRPGGLAYATKPEDVSMGPWTVSFEVTQPACSRQATYDWSVDGKVVERLTGGCRFAHVFPREGSHRVRLDLSGPGVTAGSIEHVVNVQDWLVVSIGDSVASGEGNPDRPGRVSAGWADRRCHRSSFAGTAQAALLLEKSDPQTSVTFVHLACSGATIDDGLIGTYKGIDPSPGDGKLPRQVSLLNAIERRRDVDAVLVSVGANDVYFGPSATFCIKFKRCMKRRFDPDHPFRNPLRARYADRLPVVIGGALKALPGEYELLNEALAEPLRSRVFIVEYFDPTSSPRGGYCKIASGAGIVGISPAEAQWAHEKILRPLNEAIQTTTPRTWRRVTGVEAAFQGHGYCASDGRTWVVRLLKSVKTLGLSRLKTAFAGTLHPNEAGHLETAGLIYGKLRDYFYPGEQPRSSGGPGGGGGGSGGALDTEEWGGIALGGGGAAMGARFFAWPAFSRVRERRRQRRSKRKGRSG